MKEARPWRSPFAVHVPFPREERKEAEGGIDPSTLGTSDPPKDAESEELKVYPEATPKKHRCGRKGFGRRPVRGPPARCRLLPFDFRGGFPY